MGEPELLPIFPLSNVVLFPGVKTPIHVFEPRYRQLTRDVLAGGRRIGMVVVRPEHAEAMAGNPPIFPIGCCGAVTEAQRLPDGRYELVLAGEHRVRVVEELPLAPPRRYRVARVRRLEDVYPEQESGRVARLRAAIVESVGVLARRGAADRSPPFDPELFAGVDDATFVNVVSNALALPVEEKQALLEADSIPERFARLASTLSFQRFDVESAGGSGSRQLH